MTKTLIKYQLLSFFLSLLLTGIMYCVWYGMAKPGFDEGQALRLLLIAGDIFINTILTIASLPIFFLVIPYYYKSKRIRLVLYFGGPFLISLISVAFVANNPNDRLLYLIPYISYFSIQSYFYFELRRQIVN